MKLDRKPYLDSKRVRGKKVWRIRYFVEGSDRPKCKTIGCVKESRARLELERFIEEQEGVKTAKESFGAVTTEYREHCFVRGISPATQMQQRSWEKQWFETIEPEKPFGSLCQRDIEHHINRRKKAGLKNTTLNHELSFMNGLLKFAVKMGYVDKRKIPAVERLKDDTSKRERGEVFDRLDDLLKACQGHLKAYVALLAGCGLRLSEALQLRWEDIHLVKDDNLVTVTVRHEPSRGQRTKSKKSARVPMLPFAREIVEVWHRMAPESEWVFPSPKNHREHVQSLSKSLKAAYRRAGIDDGGAPSHMLRHYYASQLFRIGLIPEALKRCVRHGDLRTLERYLHSSENFALDEFRKKVLTDPEERPTEVTPKTTPGRILEFATV